MKKTVPFLTLMIASCTAQDVQIAKQANMEPAIVINSPEDQSTYTELDSISFLATVADPNGLNDIQSVVWVSSLDESIGDNSLPDEEGLSEVVSTLSVGIHTITATATDSAGLSAAASLTVNVEVSAQDPTATITSPNNFDEFPLGDEIQLLGGVEDPNDETSALQVTWEYQAEDGTLTELYDGNPAENGTTSFLWQNAPEGNQLVRLTVTDSDENAVVDEIFIAVYDPDSRDADGDGWTPEQGDCDDSDAAISPNATEVCGDNVDNDCNGIAEDKDIDYDAHIDADCIGYGGALPVDDCDDNDAGVFVGAAEVLDGVDNDCDGIIDNDTDAYDDDGDCYCEGTDECLGSIEASCTTLGTDDCDDSEPLLNPEDLDNDGYSTCTDDCDDNNSVLNPADSDGDGYSSCGGDCDDTNALLNGNDNDGDGYSTCGGDCDDADGLLTPADLDGDGYSSCDGDCDDTDAQLNGDDNDGDGYTTCTDDCDDNSSAQNPADVDGDGYSSCDGDCDDNDTAYTLDDNDSDGYSTCTGDCNDNNGLLTPADLDNDGYSSCDGDCDDGSNSLNLSDSDGDGYSSCAGDCNDNISAVYAGAPELEDGLDNDCDGSVDEGTNAYDDDGDGYAENQGDCDDGNIQLSPGANESCDGVDNDCDGTIDEEGAIGCTTYYQDADNDGYGSTISICACNPVGDYDVSNASDCYDGSSLANPMQTTYYSSNRGDGSYDYNCNGSEDKRWTSVAGSCTLFNGICNASSGWSGSAPACGSSKTWRSSCEWEWSSFSCEWQNSSSRTQQCR